MEAMKVSDANITIYVHPSQSKKASEAILRELSSLLFKFSECFDGVVLAYDVNILSDKAKILPGVHPYFGVKLEAKLLVFHPKQDMLLEGKVVKLGEQSIHVVVLGFSSAIITEENIRKEFKYKVKHGKEVFASKIHKQHVIRVGSIIRFMVKSFDEEILHISGSLVPSHTGSIHWLDKNTGEWSQADSTNKRRRIEQERFEADSNHQIKKSKRRRSKD